MRRIRLPFVPLLAILLFAPPAAAAEIGVEAVDALVPRRIKLSVAAERSWVSVDARVRPEDVGAADWSAWDRDGSGAIELKERPPLLADLERLEVAHLSISIDGQVLPVSRLNTKIDLDHEAVIPLDARLTLRLSTQWLQPLAAGEHRIVLYDQPRSPDGVVPFRLSFGRGLKFVDGAGARGDVRANRSRVEVATTKLAPIFWGTFVRIDEAK